MTRLLIALVALALAAGGAPTAMASAPVLSPSEAEALARDAEGIPALLAGDPKATWSCVLSDEDGFWTCSLLAAADGDALATVRILDREERVWSVTIPRDTAPELRLDDGEAIAIAEREERAIAWADRYRAAGLPVRVTASLSTGTWRVRWYSDTTQIAEVGVEDDTGAVAYVRTGPQVAWSMARGGKGFGRMINEPWLFGSLMLVFALVMLDWRRLRSWRTLDVAAILSMAASLWLFNQGMVFWAVPLQYPPLVYLLVRLIAIGLGRTERPAFTTSLPLWAMLAILLVLVGGRIGLNAYSSNVVDVGFAGVVGADRILDGRSPYGSFPTRAGAPCGTRYADGSYSAYVQRDGACETAIERGDTYGPVMYVAYLPGTLALGWSGRWDELPAAHFTAGFFDLLAGLGLALFGWRTAGRRLAAALALFWFAVPWTTYTFMSDSNDAVVAALLAWSAALLARPFGRGALLMAAALAKFAPLILIPLWLRLDRRPTALPGEWPYGTPRPRRTAARRLWDRLGPGPGAGRTALGMAAVVAACAALLVALDGPGALRTFWDRTFGWQLDRPSPFSIWGWGDYPGLPDLAVPQDLLKVALVLGALALFALPRNLDPTRAIAFAGALLVGFQLVLTHWMYLYLPWALVFAAIALLAPRIARPEPVAAPGGALPERRALPVR
jgi:hypothetical protein